MSEYQDQIKQLISLGKYIMDRDMTWGNAGNISIRIPDSNCLITASGTHLGELNDNDFVQCKIGTEKRNYSNQEKKPSKELAMHTGIYKARSDISVVIHASPFYSTLLSAADINIPNNWFVEGMYYLERIERVPYFHPGSDELAEAVFNKCKHTNIILLENHGVVVYDKSIKEAKTALLTLEVTCKMLITAKSAGLNIPSIDIEIVSDFLNNSGYKPRREWGS